MERHLRRAGVGWLQRHRFGQLVVLRRAVQLAVGKDELQLGEGEHAGGEPVGVDDAAAHAPRVRMQRARDLGQAPLVVGVLTLEMLRPQEQALAPQQLRRLDQVQLR